MITSIEYMASNTSYTIGDNNRCQTCTSKECTFPNTSYTIWYINRSKFLQV